MSRIVFISAREGRFYRDRSGRYTLQRKDLRGPFDADRARVLYDKLQWIDGSDSPEWDDLPYGDREIFVSAIETVIRRHDAVLATERSTLPQ